MSDSRGKGVEILPQMLKMCSSCYRVNGEDDRWLYMGNVSVSSHTKFTHGLCPECDKNMDKDGKEFIPIPCS
jgi:hypothetical protein